MFLVKYSLGNLSEFADGYLGCLPLPLTLVVSKYIMLVALIVKQIVMLFSHLVRSFITKNQINPVMEVVTNIFALEDLSHLENKLFRGLRPRRKYHRMNLFSLLLSAQFD